MRWGTFLKLSLGLLFLALGLFVAYVAFDLLFFGDWLRGHGYTSLGAADKWYTSMGNGDAEEAKYWARWMLRYSSDSSARSSGHPQSPTYAYRCLAAAHELGEDYEQALTLYEQHPETSHGNILSQDAVIARIQYKLGRKQEAFRAYCALAVHLEKDFQDARHTPYKASSGQG